MLRILGLIFVALGAAALVADIARTPAEAGEAGFRFREFGEWWSSLHRDSLIGLNSLVENQLGPGLWDGAILPVLALPAAILLLGLGVVFLVLRLLTARRA